MMARESKSFSCLRVDWGDDGVFEVVFEIVRDVATDVLSYFNTVFQSRVLGIKTFTIEKTITTSIPSPVAMQ